MNYIETSGWTKYVPFCPTFVPKNERERDSADVILKNTQQKPSDVEESLSQTEHKNNNDEITKV